jgi:DNA-directed RNA polymerase specialized sigma24 family protein
LRLATSADGEGARTEPTAETLLVRRCMLELPERDQTILTADAGPRGKLSAADLGAILGITTNAARVARHRAQRRFKEVLLRMEATLDASMRDALRKLLEEA